MAETSSLLAETVLTAVRHPSVRISRTGGDSRARIEAGRKDIPASRRLVDDAAVPTRVVNALTQGNIYTVGQLSGMTRRELLMVKGIGRRCLDEIEVYLFSRGLSLRHDIQGVWPALPSDTWASATPALAA